MNKWIAPALVAIGIVIGGGIVYYLTRPKELTSPSHPTVEPQLVYQWPVRQSPIVCPSCGRTEYIIVDPSEDNRTWIICGYCGYKGTTDHIIA